ncbi:MAG: PucR family transcriptional regulator, partial [Janthinobacterium lividum]
ALARTTPTRPVVHADDTTHLGLLATVDGLAASATELLAPLDALPDSESHRLRETAFTFLVHHGARQPTADALGVHRNTVRARIARFEAVLGRTLDDPRDRAELFLALSAGPPDPYPGRHGGGASR